MLRVKELVSVALKHNRSIYYIVDKVRLAINKVYRARPSEDLRKIETIPLLFSSLVVLLFLASYARQISFPAHPLAYRMANDLRSLHSPVTATAAECLRNNLDVDCFASSYATSSLRVRHALLTESAVVEGFESQNWLSEHLERCTTECSLQLREAAGIGNCCGSWEHRV